MAHAPAEPADPAPALARGLRLLTALESEGAASLERLARLTDWPKSSVARLLDCLLRFGAVERDPQNLRFRPRLLLRPVAVDRPSLRAAAPAVLARLAADTGLTTELHLYHPPDRPRPLVMIDRCQPEEAIVGVRARIGFRRDTSEFDALTQVIHACDPDADRSIRSLWYWSGGRSVPVTAARRRAVLRRVRSLGFAADLGINPNGVRRWAAPIADDRGRLAAVLALAQVVTPAAQPPAPADLSHLSDAARELSRRSHASHASPTADRPAPTSPAAPRRRMMNARLPASP